MVKRWVAGLAVLLAVSVSAACGGGGDDGDGGGGGSSAAASSGDDSEEKTGAVEKKARELEVPQFLGDLERVCTTQLGYLGVSAYERGQGMVHPVVLFEDYRGEGFVESSRSLPAGWQVEQDTDYEDNEDLKVTELVACSDRTAESPTGIVCTFEGDDGEPPAKLELVDATYEVKVYAARTGELLHSTTLEATETECPFIATYEKGDKTFVDQPSDDEYIGALKPVVTP